MFYDMLCLKPISHPIPLGMARRVGPGSEVEVKAPVARHRAKIDGLLRDRGYIREMDLDGDRPARGLVMQRLGHGTLIRARRSFRGREEVVWCRPGDLSRIKGSAVAVVPLTLTKTEALLLALMQPGEAYAAKHLAFGSTDHTRVRKALGRLSAGPNPLVAWDVRAGQTKYYWLTPAGEAWTKCRAAKGGD